MVCSTSRQQAKDKYPFLSSTSRKQEKDKYQSASVSVSVSVEHQ